MQRKEGAKNPSFALRVEQRWLTAAAPKICRNGSFRMSYVEDTQIKNGTYKPGTLLEDAVPLTVGQEWSGYAVQIRTALHRIEASLFGLYELAAGGTAVGTGLNTPDNFAVEIATKIAELTSLPFITAPNKFQAQGSLDSMVAAHAALRGLAALSPVIGYDNASKIAHTAHNDGTTLRQAAIKTGLIEPKKFDQVVNPENMVGNTNLTFTS